MDTRKQVSNIWFFRLFLGLMILFGGACSSGSHGGSSELAAEYTGLAAGDYTFSFELEGYQRSYDVHVPASYDGSSPAPLVLDFHGIYQNATVERETSGFLAKADTEGFIVVYPEGISGPGGQSWNADTTNQQWYSWANVVNVDDVAYALNVVEDAKGRMNIDAGRVYVTGLSQGGAMALLCAHNRGDVFAAAAVVSAALMKALEDYNPVRPIPVISFSSYDDNIVPYDGNSSGLPPIETTVRQWATVNGCDINNPTVTSLGYTDPDHPGVAEKLTIYGSSPSGVEVQLYSLHGSHELYKTNMHGQTEAERQQYITDLAWNFLMRFTL